MSHLASTGNLPANPQSGQSRPTRPKLDNRFSLSPKIGLSRHWLLIASRNRRQLRRTEAAAVGGPIHLVFHSARTQQPAVNVLPFVAIWSEV
jgi:hypothetical protein